MGRLMGIVRHSEVTATLERLEQYGVSAKGLKNVRTMSPALVKQLAYLMEHGISKEDPLPGLPTFSLDIDSSNVDLIIEKMKKKKIFDSRYVADILQKASPLQAVEKRFVSLAPCDFGVEDPDCYSEASKLTSSKWLLDWSKKNLLGRYHLVVCNRPDSAVHIALAMHKVPGIHPRHMTLIQGKFDDWITIDATHDSGTVSIANSRTDFSYEWPAVFELENN